MTDYATDQEAVEAAARAAVDVAHKGRGAFEGTTADEIITEHVGADRERWATLIRWAHRRAIQIDPTVGSYSDLDHEASVRYRERRRET